ncbi:MAG: S1C family serine protease [Holosporales bacterium]|jgi:S1-C subfamily serine protease|nr:S1C family serine protease [Holosporales bacterium]
MRFGLLLAFIIGICHLNSQYVFSEHAANNNETDQILEVIKENSEAVVLVYTFSSFAKEDHKIYNSAIRPRLKRHHYYVGVINGIVLSENGIIVVPYEAIQNSSEIIVSINSELREHCDNEKLKLTKNDYKAKVIKSFPKRNLAFLQIKPREKLKFITLGSDLDFVNNPKKIIKKTLGVIGKAKASEFITFQKPGIASNNFEVFFSYIDGIEYRNSSGIPILIARGLHAGNAFIPETCGGPLLNANGGLVGIVYCKYCDFSTPLECAIPVFELKHCIKAAGINLPYLFEDDLENIGIGAKDLKKPIFAFGIKNEDLKALKISATSSQILGVEIESITKGSKSEAAGLKAGDIIILLNDEIVTDTKTFENLINRTSGNIIIKILSDKKIKEVEIK